jgi:hypothetical protein
VAGAGGLLFSWSGDVVVLVVVVRVVWVVDWGAAKGCEGATLEMADMVGSE